MLTVAFYEEWRDVVGFEGYYKVSNTGKVFSIRSNRLLVCKPKHTGYNDVELNLGGKPYYKRVHRLVAEAFLGPAPPGKNLVNHDDGNKLNNCVYNLEWCNDKENIDHAIRNGLGLPVTEVGPNIPMVHVLTNGQIARVYPDLNAITKATGYSAGTLHNYKMSGMPLRAKAYKGWNVLSYPNIDEFLKHTDL